MHRILATLALALAGGCSPGPRVLIDVPHGEPVAALRLSLRSSDSALAPAPVEIIEVVGRGTPSDRSQPLPRWVLTHKPGTPPLQLPTSIPYGTVPSGYVASTSAPPLTSGPYVVRVRAGGIWTESPFNVTAANTVE